VKAIPDDEQFSFDYKVSKCDGNQTGLQVFNKAKQVYVM
jgi:hypothetical protein